jgi:hypothetical protein
VSTKPPSHSTPACVHPVPALTRSDLLCSALLNLSLFPHR